MRFWVLLGLLIVANALRPEWYAARNRPSEMIPILVMGLIGGLVLDLLELNNKMEKK